METFSEGVATKGRGKSVVYIILVHGAYTRLFEIFIHNSPRNVQIRSSTIEVVNNEKGGEHLSDDCQWAEEVINFHVDSVIKNVLGITKKRDM